MLQIKKILFLAFLLLSCGMTSFAQNNSEQSLVKDLNPKGSNTIVFEFNPKSIQANSWDLNQIRLQIEIHANFPEAILKKLIKAGRYSVRTSIKGEELIVTMPNLSKRVTIRGIDLEDDIHLVLQTPGFYEVHDNKLYKDVNPEIISSVVGRAKDLSEAQSQIKKIRQIKEPIHLEVDFIYVPNKNVAEKRMGKEKMTAKLIDKQAKSLKYGDILIDGVPLEFD